jgi:hypothetical protein
VSRRGLRRLFIRFGGGKVSIIQKITIKIGGQIYDSKRKKRDCKAEMGSGIEVIFNVFKEEDKRIYRSLPEK